jgi:hypothetical protein
MPEPEERHTLILTGASRGIGGIATILLLIFGVLLAVSFTTSASAQLLPGKIDCKFNEDFGAYLPDWSAEDVSKLKGGAIQICSYSYQKEHNDNFSARLFLPPKLGTGGVCSLPSVDLYLVHDANGRLVRGDPPKDLPNEFRRDFFNPYIAMALAPAPCPAPGDVRYIDTQNMTEGLFVSLLELWGDVSARPEDLDRFLINSTIGRPEVLTQFRKALANNESLHAMKLTRVAVGGREYNGIQNRDDPDYRAGEIVMQIRESPTLSFLVMVDYTPLGFKIVRLEELMV